MSIDDILLGMAEECGVINFDISATKQALYQRLASEAKTIQVGTIATGAQFITYVPLSKLAELFEMAAPIDPKPNNKEQA